jgi:hypothetical protein
MWSNDPGRQDAMWRWRRLWLVLLAALALTVSSCGGSEDTTGGQGDGGGQGALQLARLDGQTVEVAAVWTGDEQRAFQAVLDDFARRTGATVSYTPMGDDVQAFLNSRIAGNDPPDVAMLPQPAIIEDLVGRGAAKPVGEAVEGLVTSNYAPDWKRLGSVDGKLYAVFFKAANKSMVWYNDEVFGQNGVEPPADWGGFADVVGRLTDRGVPGLSVGAGDGWVLTDWFENVYLRTAGPEKYDQLIEHEVPWTDQSVKDALTRLTEVWSDPNAIAGGYRGALSTDFPGSVKNVFSDPPEAAMVYEGDFVAGVVSGETTATPGKEARFFDFPSIAGSRPSVVGGGDAAVPLTDGQGGQELMKFLASAESAELWVPKGGFASPNKAVDLALYPDEISRRAAEALVQAEVFRFDASDLMPSRFAGTPAQGLWKGLQDFFAAPTPRNVDRTAQAIERMAEAVYDDGQ